MTVVNGDARPLFCRVGHRGRENGPVMRISQRWGGGACERLSRFWQRRSAVSLAGGLLGATLVFGSPAWARDVLLKFDVYPKNAKVFYQGSDPNRPIPLERFDEPKNRHSVFEGRGPVTFIAEAPDRKRWEGTFPESQFDNPKFQADPTFSIILEPTTLRGQVKDFFHFHPGLVAGIGLLAAFAGGLLVRLGLRKRADRAELSRQDLLKELGAEYERPFDKWVIVGKVGSGGMGEVLRAFPQDDIRRESMVAIKMRGSFDPEGATRDMVERESEDRDRFLIETKVLAGLDHPGIVRLYDWGIHEGRDYYVMELVKGESLQAYLERHPLPPFGEVRTLFSQMLDVMIFAHEKGVLHRDLKPLNILREPDGKLTIIDFGLARDQNQTVAYTQAGMPLAGSFEYMDPRVSLQMFAKIEATSSDEGTDQFALGGILFLMLTGKPSIDLPEDLDNQNLVQVLMQIGEPRPSARSLRRDLPEELDAVVAKMLAVDGEERFANLKEAKVAFLDAIRPHS